MSRSNRLVYYSLQFATGFVNAGTALPLIFIIPVMVFAKLSGKGSSKGAFRSSAEGLYLAGLVLGILFLGMVVAYRVWL